ncbi:MAG: hypothetical protein RL748_2777 [Pseudomonadota bacterium]|jgi:hypothetical protein
MTSRLTHPGLIACCAMLALTTGSASLAAYGQNDNSDNIGNRLADYQYQMPLHASSKPGVVALQVPQALYLHAQSPQLHDVRIFDAKGQSVPFALLPPVSDTTRLMRTSVPLKIFPVRGGKSSGSADNSGANSNGPDQVEMDIKTDAKGSVISVKTKQGNHLAGNKISYLVLDARAANPDNPDLDGSKPRNLIDGLRFTVPPRTSNYSAQVWLEVSDNLQHWETLGTTQLSWLINAGSDTLSNDRMQFEPHAFRYARLSWREGEALEFAAIDALTVQAQSQSAPLEQIVLQPQGGKTRADLVYSASPALPVERLALQFGNDNIVYPVSIGHYREIPAKQIGQSNTFVFEPQWQSTFYQITQDGKTRRSGEISMAPTFKREWVVRAHVPTAPAPQLILRWQAASLVFLQGNGGPYTLAYGRAQAKAGMQPLEQVAPGFSMEELQRLTRISAGPEQAQTTPQAQKTAALAASEAANSRSLVLWGVLLLGVVVLGVMAWSLIKQLKNDGAGPK